MGKCIGETNFDSKKVPLQMSSHKMSNLLLKNSSIFFLIKKKKSAFQNVTITNH